MKILLRLILVLILSGISLAETDRFSDQEIARNGIEKDDYQNRLDNFKRTISYIEGVVRDAERNASKAKTMVSDLGPKKEGFFNKVFPWFFSKKENDSFSQLTPEEQISLRTKLGDLREKLLNVNNITLDLKEKGTNLRKELDDAKKLKHKLEDKHEKKRKEENRTLHSELKNRVSRIEKMSAEAEKTARDLTSRIDVIKEQSRKIKEKYGK